MPGVIVLESAATFTRVLKMQLHHWNWLPVWACTGWKKLYASASRAARSVVPPPAAGVAAPGVAAAVAGAADGAVVAPGVPAHAAKIRVATATRLTSRDLMPVQCLLTDRRLRARVTRCHAAPRCDESTLIRGARRDGQ